MNHEEIIDIFIGAVISRQQIIDEFVDGMIPNPEHFYNNWPPPPRPTQAQLEEAVRTSDVYAWINSLKETDEIRRYNDIGDLCGSAGYVAFRLGKQFSSYATMVS